MEILQSVFEAFLNTPLLFLVPVLLLAFILWSPWSPSKFYFHQHDREHLNSDGLLSDQRIDLGIEAPDHSK